MKRSGNIGEIPLYIFAVMLALLIYWGLNYNIEITLRPYAAAMQLLYQMRFAFMPGLGYVESRGLFIIGGDCLGARLFVCLFAIFTIGRLGLYRGWIKKFCKVCCFCVYSVLLAYIVTLIRIAASMPFCTAPSFKLIHTVLSLVIYFGSGLVLYAFLDYTDRQKYAARML